MEQMGRKGFRLHLQEDFPIEKETREKVTTEEKVSTGPALGVEVGWGHRMSYK